MSSDEFNLRNDIAKLMGVISQRDDTIKELTAEIERLNSAPAKIKTVVKPFTKVERVEVPVEKEVVRVERVEVPVEKKVYIKCPKQAEIIKALRAKAGDY